MDKQTASHGMVMGMLIVNLIAVAALLYFLPTIIAVSRKHANVVSLSIVNLAFGWTAIGYVVGLASSVASFPRR